MDNDHITANNTAAPRNTSRRMASRASIPSGTTLLEDEFRYKVELPPIGNDVQWKWDETNEKQLKAALIGACKRIPKNAEAHFHLGLMYMRLCNGEEALRSFQHCRKIYAAREKMYEKKGRSPPRECTAMNARLRCHTAQAAYLATVTRLGKEQRASALKKLHAELVAATNMDETQPDTWNALALLHLNEGDYEGAKEILTSIRNTFPEYLDALCNLGVAEFALGNDSAAYSCFQNVIMCDRFQPEALANYGVVMLRRGLYEGAALAFEEAVSDTKGEGRGLAFAWGGLAVARLALSQLEEAEIAAKEAERTADPLNKTRFSMLLTSIRARKLDHDLVKEKRKSNPPSPTDDKKDARPQMDSIIHKLRTCARELNTAAAKTTLGTVLLRRHETIWDDAAHRNFGAEAAERFVEALEKDENDSSAWVQLSLLQIGAGEYGSARNFATQSVSRTPDVEAAWNALAVSYQLSNDPDDAGKAYEKGLRAALTNYDRSRDDNNEIDESPTDEKRRDDDIADPYTNPIPPEDLDQAGRLAFACIWNNIGNLRRQEGADFNEALEAYKMSIKYGGEDPLVYNNLGVLYIGVRRWDEAKDMLEHALKLDPNFQCAMSNMMKLEKLAEEEAQLVQP